MRAVPAWLLAACVIGSAPAAAADPGKPGEPLSLSTRRLGLSWVEELTVK